MSPTRAAAPPVYPGDPSVRITSALSVDPDGVSVTRLDLGSHTGTHLDAPSHCIPGGRTVDQLDLELLDGTAGVLQVKTVQLEALTNQQVKIEHLIPLPDALPSIVCIATGWDHYFHDPVREEHPFLDVALAQELWRRGARVLGVDTLSPDPTSPDSDDAPVHDFWLGNDGVIVENLRGHTHLPHEVWMTIFPLNLTGLDGSPVRAVARRL